MLKPENVLILPDVLKVTDFHLCSALSLPLLLVAESRAHAAMYVAPEMRAGAPLTPAMDVYSLGAMAIELLTGQVGSEPQPQVRRRRPALPVALAALLSRAVSPDPRTRFERPADLLDALLAIPGAAQPHATHVGKAPAPSLEITARGTVRPPPLPH